MYTNAKIAELSGDRQVSGVLLEDGTEIQAGMVLMTAGIRPDCQLAKLAGLEINKGVVVNDFLQTSHPGIFAAGDMTEHKGVLYGLWNASQFQGTMAGMNAAGQATEFGGMPRSSTLKVVGLDVVSTG